MERNKAAGNIEALLEEITALSREDQQLLRDLRKARADRAPADTGPETFGERTADRIAAIVGSWRFIIIQSTLLVAWLVLNLTAWIQAWDPYPFILLNLMLSFQAAYTAPIILMSQNRQAAIDRENQRGDYEVNLKAELEIELLHQKIDLLRAREIERLTRIIEELRQDLPSRR
ncbi:putative membrane protein [Dongia mobilis]|uniref:Putative membrane protein n=1 Tax=Dongia mobilis TaxID=578943 RepID=A0A4R6WF84_9PROT|nr:DUF1003 domain-containing protein [Dongia mobilis]TDQ78572.1 putative membrane protein [Dongia mobilis]